MPFDGHVYAKYCVTNGPESHTITMKCSRCGEIPASVPPVTEPHTEPNADGVCEKCMQPLYIDPAELTLSISSYGNGPDSSTGYVELSWNAVPDATGYYVCIFNGTNYTYQTMTGPL